MTVELVLFLVLSGSTVEIGRHPVPDLQDCTKHGEHWIEYVNKDHKEALPSYKCIQRFL